MRYFPIVATSLFALALIASALIATAAHADETICKNEQLAFAAGPVSRGATRQLIQKKPIDYPASVVMQDQDATVTVRYTVEADGRVDQVDVIGGVGAAFIQQAKAGVRQWVYSPAATATPNVVATVKFQAAP